MSGLERYFEKKRIATDRDSFELLRSFMLKVKAPQESGADSADEDELSLEKDGDDVDLEEDEDVEHFVPGFLRILSAILGRRKIDPFKDAEAFNIVHTFLLPLYDRKKRAINLDKLDIHQLEDAVKAAELPQEKKFLILQARPNKRGPKPKKGRKNA
jgi:hypothetical protein